MCCKVCVLEIYESVVESLLISLQANTIVSETSVLGFYWYLQVFALADRSRAFCLDVTCKTKSCMFKQARFIKSTIYLYL